MWSYWVLNEIATATTTRNCIFYNAHDKHCTHVLNRGRYNILLIEPIHTIPIIQIWMLEITCFFFLFESFIWFQRKRLPSSWGESLQMLHEIIVNRNIFSSTHFPFVLFISFFFNGQMFIKCNFNFKYTRNHQLSRSIYVGFLFSRAIRAIASKLNPFEM